MTCGFVFPPSVRTGLSERQFGHPLSELKTHSELGFMVRQVSSVIGTPTPPRGSGPNEGREKKGLPELESACRVPADTPRCSGAETLVALER